MTKDSFFVELKAPQKTRKAVFETLRETLNVLKGFEKFKSFANEKGKKIRKLKNDIRDANKLLADLKLKLPKVNIKTDIKKTKKIPEKKEKEPPKENISKKPMSELESLEFEIRAIEDKLKGLN